MDVWTYFAQKEKEFAELSLEPDREPEQIFAEEAGSNGRRGRLLANLILIGSPVDAYLRVYETVVVRGKQITREEYAYFLIIDREEVWGYERDPTHVPAVHMHTTAAHVRELARPMAFKKAAELAWEEVTRVFGG